MSKKIKKIISIAAPIVGGIFGGPVGAAVGGALGGAVGGGGIQGALMGGITGYMGAGAGGALQGLGSAASTASTGGITGVVGQAVPGNVVRSSVLGVGAAANGGLRALSQPILGNITTGQLLNAASGIVGGMNKDAAEEAARKQAAGIQAGMDANAAAMQPYTQMGAEATRRIGEIQADPAGYIQNNPLYNSLAADAERRLLANQAAKGKVGSGGTAAALQEQMLNIGTGLVNQEINNLSGQAGMGAGAASQVGSTAYQGAQGIGNAQAAGVVGANNAMTAQYQNQINTILAMQGLNKAPTYSQPISL